jgi:hypothetical protein
MHWHCLGLSSVAPDAGRMYRQCVLRFVEEMHPIAAASTSGYGMAYCDILFTNVHVCCNSWCENTVVTQHY